MLRREKVLCCCSHARWQGVLLPTCCERDRVGGGYVLEVLPGDSSCSTGTSCCCIIGENYLNEFQKKNAILLKKKGAGRWEGIVPRRFVRDRLLFLGFSQVSRFSNKEISTDQCCNYQLQLFIERADLKKKTGVLIIKRCVLCWSLILLLVCL